MISISPIESLKTQAATPCRALQGLLGGFSNLVEVMRGEGSPPTAVRAVVFGALCQLDAELLNQLLVRRDCCTMSAIKILQARRDAHTACAARLRCRACPVNTALARICAASTWNDPSCHQQPLHPPSARQRGP